jgi:hypothetical protein
MRIHATSEWALIHARLRQLCCCALPTACSSTAVTCHSIPLSRATALRCHLSSIARAAQRSFCCQCVRCRGATTLRAHAAADTCIRRRFARRCCMRRLPLLVLHAHAFAGFTSAGCQPTCSTYGVGLLPSCEPLRSPPAHLFVMAVVALVVMAAQALPALAS